VLSVFQQVSNFGIHVALAGAYVLGAKISPVRGFGLIKLLFPNLTDAFDAGCRCFTRHHAEGLSAAQPVPGSNSANVFAGKDTATFIIVLIGGLPTVWAFSFRKETS